MTWRDIRSDRDSNRSIYFEDIGKAIAALIPAPDSIVLDYGCGDAPAAEIMAEKSARLFLYEPAPKIQAALRQRYAKHGKIIILSESELKALPDGSLDMVMLNSVLQYLTREACNAAVAFAAAKLKLGGRLVVTDVVPPHADPLSDSWALVEFAYRRGFLGAALRGFVKTFFSRRLSGKRALTTFAIPDMQRLLSTHGFETRRAERNIGHSQTRMTFLAKRV